ncbi:MAG: DegT/DnrJ/EryC1/StrS family aminotransferase [Acidobacteria bacterium]|jgi:dTDP-4-amino-4,6-dideoxygalactose transaminase|nr:DegT/DnrJ/EryC1/StrS family aminotransferase [Acidobacteriota bacterium]
MPDTLALHGGTPVRTRPWPKWPTFDASDEKALLDALHGGVWGIGGPRVGEFECKYSALQGARYGVACCNGTIALEIALIAAGVKPGDEVITSPYTFMASAMAVVEIGAVPVFVDVEPGTHNLDPRQIDAAVSERTTCIMPVHIGGRPADMDGVLAAAQRHGLSVVEDAAQGWMAAWRGTPVGALGNAGIFSFQSSKNISSGEGGIVLTNDEATFQRAWSYHNCGRRLGGEWYAHDFPGLNLRLGEFQAAILLAMLERLPAQQERRRAAMAVLQRELARIPGLLVPDDDPRITAHACHMFMVRLDPAAIPAPKAEVIKALHAEGIPANPGYTMPLYRQGLFAWYGERPTHWGGPKWKDAIRVPYASYDLPVTQRLCDTTIWVKQETLLAGAEEMGDVVAAFAKVADAARAGRLAPA